MSGPPNGSRPRDVLPIPDVTPVTPTTFDAKDPDPHYPPIPSLRPVELTFGDDAKQADHYVEPEQRLNLAMAIQ